MPKLRENLRKNNFAYISFLLFVITQKIELLEYDSEVRKQLEREAIIAKERQERDEAWLKMTDEEKLRDYEKTVEDATKFAEKMGMNIYELKNKDE